MASSPGASCLSDPNFAVICAFLERFAKSCGISYPTFTELQEMLENVEEVPQELIDLHIKLLRKARKTVFLEKWEKALIKFCHTYSNQDGWELERFGYKKTRLEVKLRVLKMLLEGQFDLNSKFKATVNTLESEELRSKPLGKDKLGRVYWLQFDPTFNIRVYREDMDEESWTLVAQDRASLVILLQQLCENEYALDLNLLNGDNIQDLQEETLDTGQNNISTLKNEDHIELDENFSKISEVDGNITDMVDMAETEKLNMNDTFTQSSNLENCSKIDNNVVEDNNSENLLCSSEINGDKPLSIKRPYENDDLGDVIEEPVMYITGEGSGEDCMTGNPEKEDKSEEESQKLISEKIEVQELEGTSHCSSKNIASPRINLEKIKPAPKLWSIDTICGVNSSNETEEKNSEGLEGFDVKLKQKNFSTFSIDSVLEKKDLISLSGSKTFSQFSVGSSNETFSENIQFKESEHSENKSNSDINNSIQCNSGSSMISYKNSKVLPCVMISKTENLVGKSQDSKAWMNEMDSSFIVPPSKDLTLESVEENIKSQTQESREVISNKCEQTSDEKEIFYGRETNINVDGSKTFSKQELQSSEKISEKEFAGGENNDLKGSEIIDTHDTNKNNFSNKNVIVNEIVNVVKLQKNFDDEMKKRDGNDIDGIESIKSEPLLPLVVVEEETKSISTTEEKVEEIGKSKDELMPINIENSYKQKQNIMKCTINEPCHFENNLKKVDYVQSKISDSEKSSGESEDLKAMGVIETNFLRDSSDQVVLQNKTSHEKKAEGIKGEEENIENISFKCKSQEGNEILIKNKLVVPKDNVEISSTTQFNKRLLNLPDTHVFLVNESNENLQGNEKSLFDVDKFEENKKAGNEMKKLTKVSKADVSEKSEKYEVTKSETEEKNLGENKSTVSETSENKKLEEDANKMSEVVENEAIEYGNKKVEESSEKETKAGESSKLETDEAKKLEGLDLEKIEAKKPETDESKNSEPSEGKEVEVYAVKKLEPDETNKSEIDEDRKLEEYDQGTSMQENKILSGCVKSGENVFAKIGITLQAPKEENFSDDDLETDTIVEDKTNTSQFLEKKEEKISDSLSINKGKEKKPANTNNVKNEKVESIFKSNVNVSLSEIEEIPDQQEKKQLDSSLSEDKRESSENEEAEKIIDDFDYKEKPEEYQVIKSTDNEKQEEIKLQRFTISDKICEKLEEANDQKLEENLETDLNLIEGNEDTSKIKIINSISEKVNNSQLECAFSNNKIALNETSESLEEEKLVESDAKANQVMSDSHELSLEEDEISDKNLSNDVPLNEHITEVNVIPELKSVEERDMKLDEIKNEKLVNLEEENTKTEETSEKSTENITVIDETKEISQKSVRKRKKGSVPARIMSRNRKTVDTTEELDTTTSNTIKSVTDLKIEDEKVETLSEFHSETVEENVEQKDKEEERSENDDSLTEKKEVEEKKSEVTPVRRGRKPRGRKRRKNIASSGENKSATEEVVKDKPKVSEDDKEASSVKRKGRPKKDDDNIRTGGRQITSREIKLLGITNPDVELTSVRQSRRIAQIKMREEAERRRLEALQLESFKSKKKTPKAGKKKSRKNDDSDSYDEKDGANEGESEDGKSKPSKDKKSRRKKKKDKLVFNELNPWLSSSGSSSADEEEEEIEEEPHDDEELVFKSDHEFSPESDVEDPDYKPVKRARTAKVEESKEEPGKYDDTSCEKCAKNDHPEWILLCDKCDKGWHASCVRPALMIVPEGDWFCPPCEHSSLIMKLQESLKQFDRCQRQREIEEMRKKRLAFVGISLDNVLPLSKKSSKTLSEDVENEEKASNLESESGSERESADTESGSDDSSEPVYQLRERRSNVTSYRYNEYDELIKSALQDEIEAVKGAGNAGRGKDINNIVNAEKQKQEKETQDGEEENESIRSKTVEGDQENQIDVCAKERVMKDDDEFEKNSDGNLVEEEEKDVVDEIPPVVPKDHSKKKKSKSLKITSLDFTSEEEDHNSDSDFKGASSEDESDYSLPSESESSDDRGKSKRNGPLRRSTRARTSRYDRDFINDESDDSPKRKKVKREWDSSESSDSDQSWGRKKRKGNRSTYKTVVKHSRKRGKKNKGKRKINDSDNEEILTSPRPRNKKIKYGGLDSLDEQPVLSKRTRGKKINYQEMNGSDSEDEVKNQKARPSRVIESDDDFIAENEKDEDGHEEESEEIESEIDEDEEEESGNEDFSIEKERSRKNERVKRKGLISDSDEYDKNDEEANEDILSNTIKDPENVNIKKEENIENNLDSGSASNQEKFFLEEERLNQSIEKTEAAGPIEKEMSENKLQNFPSNTTSDYSGSAGKFPKFGKMKITPSRAEMASHSSGVPSFNFIVDIKKPVLTQDIGLRNPSENTFTSEEFVNQSPTIKSTNAVVNPETNFLLRTLQSTQKPNSVDASIPSSLPVSSSIIQSSRSPLTYPGNTPSGSPLNMIALLNSQNQGVPIVDNAPVGTPLSTANSGLQFSTFKGVISPPPSMSMPPSKIPTTVTGISEIESQNQSKKKASKSKKKSESFLPSPENGSDIAAAKDNVWPTQQTEEFRKMQGVQDSTPKKKGRGRGKKQLLAEAQAQALARTQEKQDASQFLPQAIPGEGGSVISRILNTSQGSSSFPRCEPNQFIETPRIRPSFSPNLPPNFPSHRPMAHMRPRPSAVGGTIFHTSHPLDPSPSGGGAINISVANSGLTKPSPPISSPFTRGATLPIVPPRFPPDPNMRPLFTSRNSPRPEFSPFPHFYGNFPPPSSSLPNSENSNFSSSTFSESFGEDTQGSGSTSNPKQFEDETGGEFGGLASYFASQREDDLET